VGEPTTQVFLGQLGNGEQERERHVLADDRGRLEQPLVLGDRRSMRAARIAWTVAGTWIAVASCAADRPPFPDQRLGLREGPHALLEEQRVALRPLNEGALERVQARSVPSKLVRRSSALSAGNGSMRSCR
jgi:hypothetical protein